MPYCSNRRRCRELGTASFITGYTQFANVSHRFRNLSKAEPMRILWIYENPQAARTITATGATAPVSAEHGKKP